MGGVLGGELDVAPWQRVAATIVRMALPVLRWSQGQDPECRHFAMIYDSVPESKDAYKEGLEAVETYFYIRKMN